MSKQVKHDLLTFIFIVFQFFLGTPLSNSFDESFADKHDVSTFIDTSSHWYRLDQETILAELRSRESGGYKTSGKLNDWCISRQRYWGTPIPIIHCNHCGVMHRFLLFQVFCSFYILSCFLYQTVPVPMSELPVRLPPLKNIRSSSKTGISPLANAHDWLKTQCPK